MSPTFYFMMGLGVGNLIWIAICLVKIEIHLGAIARELEAIAREIKRKVL